MKKAYIKAITYYLPEKQLTNDILVAEFPEWTAEKVAKKIGISVRHIAGENETAADMAYHAANQLFSDHAINPESIDFVMLCTQSPDYFLPTSACILQNRLNIPTKSGAIDFNLGCSGFVYGLALAKGLIVSGVAKNILLLTAETYSKFLHPKDKANRTIFGDAASATLISNEGFAEIMEFSLGTDGSGADQLIVKSGGLRSRDKFNDFIIDESGNPISSDNLFMDGTGIFNFTLEMVPKLVEDTLLLNNLSQSQINTFVFHQANKYMLSFLRKKIQIPEEKFYYYMDQVGNTVSSTIPIALCEAMKENTIGKDDLVLLAGFGVGYSWGGTILKFS
ncbi:MAG: ketoacyl-ACP synthase III [Bacteroidetes bacterium]|nr:ketoacyl-ACP synthase III [Bacteroidota bacterium]